MNFKSLKPLIHFLFIWFGLHWLCRFLNWQADFFVLVITPAIFSVIFVLKALIAKFKKSNKTAAFNLIIGLLFFMISIKIQFYFYNIFVFILVLAGLWYFLLKRKYHLINDDLVKIMLVLLIFNSALVFTPDNLIFNYIYHNTTGYRKLTLDDFQGEPIATSKHDAVIDVKINYKINKAYNYPRTLLYANMDFEKSWFREKRNNNVNKVLLNHEQNHFRISEHHKVQLENQLSNYWFESEETIDSIIYVQMVKEDIHHKEFDKLTNHGIDTLMENQLIKNLNI